MPTPSIAECVFNFNAGGYKWTEAFAKQYSDPITTFATVESDWADLANARIATCGIQTYLVGGSVADITPGTKRKGKPITLPGLGLNNPSPYPGNTDQENKWASDSPDVALLVDMYDSAYQRRSPHPLRGMPDGICNYAGHYTPNQPWSFQPRLDTFLAMLKDPALNWGFMGADLTEPRTALIDTITQDVDGHPIITTKSDLYRNAEFAKYVKASVSGVDGSSNINGQRILAVDSARVAKMLRRTPIFPYLGGGRVTVMRVEFAKIRNTIERGIRNRKAAGPLAGIRGRAKVRLVG